jgi:ribose transport system permease protein
MGTVILIGVLADQYLAQRGRHAATVRGRPKADVAAAPLERAKAE